MIPLKVKYSELRALTESVVDFMKTEYWWEEDSSIRSELEYDLGITDDDAWELMEKFSKKYHVNLDNFKFEQYFLTEGPSLASVLLIPVYILMPLIYILKNLLSVLIRPIHQPLSKRLSGFKVVKTFTGLFPRKKIKEERSLTIGDLVTSAACGEFRKRNEVRFEMDKG